MRSRIAGALGLVMLLACGAPSEPIGAGIKRDAGPNADLGSSDLGNLPDAGPVPGTYEWCVFLNEVDCAQTDCSSAPPQHTNANGYCDCVPGTRPNWLETCRGQENGACREEEPRCDQGLLCDPEPFRSLCIPAE